MFVKAEAGMVTVSDAKPSILLPGIPAIFAGSLAPEYGHHPQAKDRLPRRSHEN
jgi:hypothetical protein